MKKIELRRFLGCGVRAVLELWKVLLLLVGLVSVDVALFWWIGDHALSDSARTIAAWLFGNGSSIEGYTLAELCLLLVGGLLGYCLLGLIVWIMTVAARKAERSL